jgi:hypothetical protein
VRVMVEVRSLSGRREGFRGQFMVDAAAVHCMAPASKLLYRSRIVTPWPK